MNLRTLRGTLESKLQRNGVQGMLGFVVPGPLCCVMGSVVPRALSWNAGKCSLFRIAQCNLLSSQNLSVPSGGSGPLEPLQI